jgi:hypothetical protein
MMRITIEPPPHLPYANKPKALFAVMSYRYSRIARRLEGNVEKNSLKGKYGDSLYMRFLFVAST